MKPYLLFACFFMLLACRASAQRVIKAMNAYKYLREKVFIYDTVYKCTYAHNAVGTIYLGADADYKRVVIKVKPSVGYKCYF